MEHVLDVKKLVNELTLEEKASLCSGADFWHTKAIDRLNIPAAMVSDGPHGIRKQESLADHMGVAESIKAIGFPTASAMACSFDATCCIKSATLLAKNVSLKILPYYWARALI